MEPHPIVAAVWRVTLVLFAAQAAIVATVALGFRVDPAGSLWLPIVSFVLHGAMGVILSALRGRFTNVTTGERLTRVNIANVLSMIRVSSSPTLLWLVLLAGEYPVAPILVALAALVFLTDLLDGQISRRTGQVTQIGRYLDSSSDYTVLGVVSIALVSYGLIEGWFFWIVVARFGAQIAAQVILLVAQRFRLQFRTSFLGKASVFAVMVLFAFSLLRLVEGLPAWYPDVFAAAEYLVAAILVISLVEKLFLFMVDARNLAASRER